MLLETMKKVLAAVGVYLCIFGLLKAAIHTNYAIQEKNGSLYDRYTLMLYVDDGYKNFDLYGAKAKNANSIRWNK